MLLDGAMGTELARRGVATPAPAWSARALEIAPDVVAAIHREYAAAGASVHIANTFRTKRRAVGAEWERLARRAVAIARDAVPCGHLVVGSVAPVEDCYRPDLSPGLASRAEHRELASVLVDAGVDRIVCETFPIELEAVVAVEEATRAGAETWVALTAGPDGSLMSPDALARAAKACVAAGARAVLVNCVAASRTLPYVERIADLGVPFGAYANAGDPSEGIGWDADPSEGARRYALLARAWRDAGATLMGGCCGTGPVHVAELRKLSETVRAPPRNI
jgi:S-methylmethionine-dependent homocysteine/selenocysteine methylase